MPSLAADGDTEIYLVDGPTHIHCSGTFGGGTITWKIEGDDGSYHDIANAGFSSAADKTLSFPRGIRQRVKGTLAGSTSPDLYYQVSAEDLFVDA